MCNFTCFFGDIKWWWLWLEKFSRFFCWSIKEKGMSLQDLRRMSLFQKVLFSAWKQTNPSLLYFSNPKFANNSQTSTAFRCFCDVFGKLKYIHPWKLTWHSKVPIFHLKYIFKWWKVYCHVGFFGWYFFCSLYMIFLLYPYMFMSQQSPTIPDHTIGRTGKAQFIYIYIYLFFFICLFVCSFIYTCMFICLNFYLDIYIYICMSFYLYIYSFIFQIYTCSCLSQYCIYVPRHPDDPCFDWKRLFLESWPSKVKVKRGPGYTHASRWWFQFLCSPLLRQDSHFDKDFSIGLKPPTRHIPVRNKYSMVVSGSLNRWVWYHIIPQLAVYTTYIPLIILVNWVIIWYQTHLLRQPGFTPLLQPARFEAYDSAGTVLLEERLHTFFGPPKWWRKSKGNPLLWGLNPGWWNIMIWPDGMLVPKITSQFRCWGQKISSQREW